MTDRNYYRTEEDQQLIEEAKYNPNSELAVVLAERLDDILLEAESDLYEANERTADANREVSNLDDKVYELQLEINKLELMLGERDRIIDELKKGN
jgi:peptidoglycan hydrolase CwlO-like protein